MILVLFNLLFACAWFGCGFLELRLDQRYWERRFPRFKWYCNNPEKLSVMLMGPIVLIFGCKWRKDNPSNGRRYK